MLESFLCSGATLLVRKDNSLSIYDASAKGKDSKKDISTGGLEVDRVPKEEWREAFVEVWRRFRDYFYVTNMHGYDWNALRQQYERRRRFLGLGVDRACRLLRRVAGGALMPGGFRRGPG